MNGDLPTPPPAIPDASAAPAAGGTGQPAVPGRVSRRRQWLATVAVGAGAAAAGLAWFSRSQSDESAVPMSAADLAFWALDFDAPEGGKLPMARFKGQRLLVNFWATWCPPCVEELPLIDAFFAQNSPKGFQVLGIAADNGNAVRAFTAKMPLRFPVALAGLAGVELSRSLGNLSGGLPFTVVFGAAGKVLHRKMGRITPQDLTAWAQLQ